ncbi:acyl-CoA thioester hydrolase/BAAT C-terminal domain-containing protein [Actinosynnema mirum]|uniref:acyl-CoA thioester hydrolase/BAAT C-terminal domain-containing protein n=1 Tax=Actinosynnema mirum TaxID=40567 RepID=UPI0002D722DF|nr:acyl-CoA thioester hydrolase/BAAT C-terminal domain-containing protein [Actinosynnema mirum]
MSGASAVVEVELERLSVPDGVRRVEFAGGVLFEPEGGGSGAAAAGVIVLGGSEGGLRELDAALLAGHGFAVLALPYFGAPGVPENLVDVPLEHVGGAVDALAERVGGPVGLVGGSRGGELALLAASVLPSVRAVVSVVGSGVVTQCVGAGKRLLEILEVDAAAWTWKGQPVPYLPHVVSPGMRAAIVDGEPVVLAEAFDLGDGFPEDVEIPVERIAGPVLLVSGDRDASWPSADLSEVAHRRLEANDHPHPHEHVVHPGAGHLLAGPPNRPQPDNVVDGPGVRFEMGGDRATTARAKADTWNRTTTFLKTHLKTRPKSQLKTQGSPDRTA